MEQQLHGGNIYKKENQGKIDFSANINFLGMPESVKQAAVNAVADSIHYPDPECSRLRREISRKEQIPEEQIICGNGAAAILFSLVLAWKPKHALLFTPAFLEYEQALQTVGCEIHRQPLSRENQFCLGKELVSDGQLEKMIPETMDLVFLCNPNNPTGILTERAIVERMLQRCESVGALLVVDECFLDFLEEAEEITMKNRITESKALFILKAFTKMYAMPGLRLGYGFCPKGTLAEQIQKVTQPWSVSVPAEQAGIAALQEDGFVAKTRKAVTEEREYLKHQLEKLGMKVYPSKANYIFFSGETGLREACREKGFLIRDCSNYDGLQEGDYRIAVRKHKENEQLIQALGEILWQKQL